MKYINLSQNYQAIVDSDDFEYLNQFKWHCRKTKNNTYAVRNANKTTVQMHRFILNVPKDKMVDHINGNGLDNRKSNLRIVTRSQNLMNSNKPKGNATSKYKGVCKVTAYNTEKPWRSEIRLNGKATFLGYFRTEKLAAKAYNEAAIRYFGEFARINKI